ncbi:hypothetical protein FH609_015375 [Streptomyces sp. 3MP-14]|uniref:Uncharacterized protein n=1 Tax=Streptomyces mimosae TaxID=2586635 RepID=A0A5N6ACK3_9ACTN|nr:MULTISPECIES: hypothetical protein [Streptomyces]KAB8165783.1 hypothetical protein FH607_012700 [Streptomyces mimosae]KAB8176172.1 hypothetical protein FH609_015375 [Streptomyces sp. 3MP-14]
MTAQPAPPPPAPPPPEPPLRFLADRMALWGVGQLSSEDLVDAACTALLAGVDAPALRELAGVARRDAPYEVPLLIPEVAAQLGLDRPEPGPATGAAALAALAAMTVRGELAPAAFVSRAQDLAVHDPALDRRLVHLAADYGYAEDFEEPTDALDAAALAEARRLAARPPAPLSRPAPPP